MQQWQWKSTLWLLSVMMVLCVVASWSPVAVSRASAELTTPPSAPVVPELAVGGVEVVGSEVVATMTVMARTDLPNVQIQIELPEGLERTAGEPTWRGQMAAGEVRIVEIAAKLLTPGRQQLVGRVRLSDQHTPAVYTADRWLDVQP